MSRRPKILVSGYGQWAKAETNPAAEVVARLQDYSPAACDLVAVSLPVDSAGLQAEVDRLLDLHQPDGWIGLGVSSAPIILPEMIGTNWRHFSVPDIAGTVAQASPTIPDGPAAYNSTLPNQAFVEALLGAGIPAKLSFFAGTHLCNQLIYTLAHSTETRGAALLSGFVHIPQSPENIAKEPENDRFAPSMCLSISTQAIRVCIDTLADHLLTRGLTG